MNRNNQFIQDTEIDLKQIIKKLWKEKILIFFITFVFVIFNLIYTIILSPHIYNEIYTTQVTVREPPLYLFRKYEKYMHLDKNRLSTKLSIYDYSLRARLSSIDNMNEFVRQNNELDEFKSYLKNKNINISNYFIGKFTPILTKEDQGIIQYIFTFEKPLQGEVFLNNYIIFTKNKIDLLLKKDMLQFINLDIDQAKKNLDIAEKNNINSSHILTALVNPSDEYYKGSKILFTKIEHLKDLLNETKDLKLDYHPILEKVSPAIRKNSTDIFASTIAMGILGLFCSLIIIYIKNIIK
jgi:LPS O-antigen subunit length determinant protein (WzzB/FepE family)